MTQTGNYAVAADLLPGWRHGVQSGEPPVFYPIGDGELRRIEIGPGLVTLIGGAPGAGKTAFTMQAVIDALRLTQDLKAMVCNVEMSPSVLLDRQLSRISGIDLGTIRHRRFGPEHEKRLGVGIATLADLAPRLAFVRPPFDLVNLALSARAFGARLLVLDYIQRIAPPGEHGDKRGAIDATMGAVRTCADAGIAVVIVAAVSRGKDSKGRSTYDADALSLASYRESSELEFGADDAFILAPDGKKGDGVNLRHLKARHGEARDMALKFDRPHQSFTPASRGEAWNPNAIKELWDAAQQADSQGGPC